MSTTNAQQALASASAYISVTNAQQQAGLPFAARHGHEAALAIADTYLKWLNKCDASAAKEKEEADKGTLEQRVARLEARGSRLTMADTPIPAEIYEHAQELMDCWPGLDYEAALSRARIELGRRSQ